MADAPMPRSQLLKLVAVRFSLGIAGLAAMFFIPAGTIRYWQAWVWLAILILPMLVMLVYMIRKDPALLERRMRLREPDKIQGLWIRLSWVWFAIAFLIPGLDRRFGWSRVPTDIVIVSDVLVFLGYFMFMLVMRENSFASRVVEVEREQKVIDTGPYAVIRHPLYLSSIILYAFTPMALGSYWALPPMLLIIPLLTIMRIPNEEQVLQRDLPGYTEYMQKVKFRLIPGVW
jgi:protein-S-isoprenylcysteine O-methyltransferase Ste14